MSEKIVQLNEEIIKGQIKELVRGSVEETLNELLEKEAESLTQAARYERNEARQGYRSGHYDRNLTTTSGNITLHMPRLKGISFETAIIERYRRRESSVEEALIEMYLAGVSVRRVEDITEALWGSKVSPATISELNKKAYVHIEDWRNRPLQGGHYPYVYVDGIYLRRNWGGEYENVAVLVAIAVNEDDLLGLVVAGVVVIAQLIVLGTLLRPGVAGDGHGNGRGVNCGLAGVEAHWLHIKLNTDVVGDVLCQRHVEADVLFLTGLGEIDELHRREVRGERDAQHAVGLYLLQRVRRGCRCAVCGGCCGISCGGGAVRGGRSGGASAGAQRQRHSYQHCDGYYLCKLFHFLCLHIAFCEFLFDCDASDGINIQMRQ